MLVITSMHRAVSNVKYELGVFLWVRLIIDTLSQATVIQEFEEAVENLPEGLDQVSVIHYLIIGC